MAAGFFESFAGAHQLDVDEPEEDLPLLRHTFRSWSNTNIYLVPEYGRWLATAGSQPAYGYHRRALQHFTWQRHMQQPGQEAQWLLKAPVHLMELEALVGAYPDACFIQTHREPREFTGSWVSLIEQLRTRTTEPIPRDVLGAEQLTDMSAMLDRAVDFREAHPELQQRWCDVSYVDLVDNPWATVRAIYAHFGWTLEPGRPRRHGSVADAAGGAAPGRGTAPLPPGGLRPDPRAGRRRLLPLRGVHRRARDPHVTEVARPTVPATLRRRR